MNFLMPNQHPDGPSCGEMSYILQKQNSDGQIADVPDGLKEIMTDISREVLREQPENIYDFVADYLEEMVMQREHVGITENVLDKVIDDSVIICELIHSSGINLEGAKKSAKIMDKSFKEYLKQKNNSIGDGEDSIIVEKNVCRKILETCNLTPEEESQLRKIVQTCFKHFYFREKTYKLKVNRLPDAHWANRAEKTLDIYRKAGPEKWKLQKAAVVIQSAYRSYYTRKVPIEMKKFNECATKIQTWYRAFGAKKKEKAAATTIQANFKGYLERKQLLFRIKCLQRIQHWSKYIGIIRSLARKIVNEAMGIVEFEPDSETYLFILEIVNKIISCSMPNELRETVECTSQELIDGIIHYAVDSVFDRNSNESDIAATQIQKAYRGYKVRKELQRKIDNIHKILNTRADETLKFKAIDLGIFDIINSIQDEIE